MAHELFGERFLGKREPAWHGLGTVFTENISPVEAVHQADMAFNITTEPLLVELGGVYTSYGKVAIVREPTDDDDQYRVFGEAKEGYTFLQNVEIAELLEPIAKLWPVETIGALHNGATMFLTLDAGEREIMGDLIKLFFMISDTRDGLTAFGIDFTPVRAVCANTLMMGKEAAVVSAKLRHTESIREEVEWRVEILEKMHQVMEKGIGHFETMAQAALTPRQITEIIKQAYPYPRTPRKVQIAEQLSEDEMARVSGLLEAVKLAERDFETAKARADERRTAVRELLGTFNEDNPQVADTAWATYNAIVEMEDYREKGSNEDPLVSALFGDRARVKQRAFGQALKYAEAEMAVVR